MPQKNERSYGVEIILQELRFDGGRWVTHKSESAYWDGSCETRLDALDRYEIAVKTLMEMSKVHPCMGSRRTTDPSDSEGSDRTPRE
jgi:hypothetical protein